MKLKEALALFEEIVELCYVSGNPRIIEVLEEIYTEVSEASDVSIIKSSLEELQVAINEQELLPEEEDYINDVQEKIEMLSE
jgi:hypothetical protein